METVNFDKFSRIGKEELGKWLEYKDSNSRNTSDRLTIAKDSISIHFPSLYIRKGLCKITDTAKILTVLAIVNYTKKQYAVLLAPCLHVFNPIKIKEVMVGQEAYTEFLYEHGDVIMPTEYTIVTDEEIYTMFSSFYINGKIPWFLEYEDVANMFLETRKYAGSSVGDNPIGPHIITAIMARYKDNLDVYYRSKINLPSDIEKIGTPGYVGLSNPYYSFVNTTARIIGSRLQDGIIADIQKPNPKMQDLDKILIK